MNKEDKKMGKRCFIITPIGNENSDTFRKAKGVIESAIKPVLKEKGFTDIKPAYEINVSGMINTQIINRIIEDDLVIANLTGNNPNVMYELCLRHVVAKPIIHICEEGTNLPFDIKDNRTIFYTNDMLGVEELKDNILKFLLEIKYEKEYMDNPIYSAYRYGKLLKETQGTESNEVINLLVDISGKITELQSANRLKNNSNYLAKNTIIFQTEPYSQEQFERDIKNIDEVTLTIFATDESPYKMKVYELAEQLGIPSKAILKAAEQIGLNIKYPQSSIESEDVKKIANYLYNQR